MNQTYRIIYFSGTGGTAKTAELLAENLKIRGSQAVLQPLDLSRPEGGGPITPMEPGNGVIILLYPVYAGGAPAPVYRWLHSLPPLKNIRAGVISVSGGGEIWPNTNCRRAAAGLMRSKGIKVFYENMVVLPSNIFIPTPPLTAERLLEILPERIKFIARDITEGRRRRSRLHIFCWIFGWVPRQFHKAAVTFGRKLTADDSCTGCGWCAAHCPQANIRLKEGRPVFRDSCAFCMRCLYGCPEDAIHPSAMKSMVLPGGYKLNSFIPEPSEEGVSTPGIPRDCRGLLWTGVRRYIRESWQDKL